MNASDVGRQPLPEIGSDRNAHHAGSTGELDLSETRISIPLTTGMPASSCNESTARSEPVFVLHANALFMTPPSAKQLSQRMLMPGSVGAAIAVEAIVAAARTKSAAMRVRLGMRDLPGSDGTRPSSGRGSGMLLRLAQQHEPLDLPVSVCLETDKVCTRNHPGSHREFDGADLLGPRSHAGGLHHPAARGVHD